MAELKTDAIAMMEKYMSKEAIEMANKMYKADLQEIEKDKSSPKVFTQSRTTSFQYAYS